MVMTLLRCESNADSTRVKGTWIRDVQQSLPQNTTFVGTDVSPQRLPPSTSTVTYSVQDVNSAWPSSWSNSFDLVHQRLVLAACPNAVAVVQTFVDLAKPDGWIQFVEADNETSPDDGPAHKHFVALLIELFASFGAVDSFSKKLAGWLKDANCVDVQEEVIEYYVGAKMKDETLREQSVESSCIAITGLIAYARSKSIVFEIVDQWCRANLLL